LETRSIPFSFLSGSKGVIIFIAAFWILIVSIYKPWQKNQVVGDVVSYYGYLPALFIEKDISLKFTEGATQAVYDKYCPELAPNGGKVIKMTMGLSFMYAPFFLAAHAIAPLMHEPQDGYSVPYQFSLLLSCFVFLIIGLVFLRKLLLLFFSEEVTILTIVSVFFGTNLFWYSSFNGLMAHGYLFSLTTLFIYLIVKWHRHPGLRTAIFIGLTGGLITLIRPTMILSFLVFFLYDVNNKPSFFGKVKTLTENYKSIITIGVSFFIVILPQLIYWKYITGSWVFFSYVGEGFYFSHPHILEGLFGFRKGWLVYTPVMSFAVFGLFKLKKELPSFFLSMLVLFPVLLYVFFSWWCWWYGGSFGLRALIDFYGLFALPMACFYKHVIERKGRLLKGALFSIIGIFICLNIFQSWQFYKGYLHYDSMTREAYFKDFFARDSTNELFRDLDEPDYYRARSGLSEAYSEKEISQIKPTDVISLKGYNSLFVSCEQGTTKELNSVREWGGKWEKFSLIYIGDHKVALKTSEGKFAYSGRLAAIH